MSRASSGGDKVQASPEDLGPETINERPAFIAADDWADLLVVGAGISGISAAYHLQKYCPDRSYQIFEGRAALGGTWDLFRYPGIRSDSDMFTLGFSFRPWTGAKAIADGPSILKYLQDTVREYGIDDKIRYHRQVKSIQWNGKNQYWQVDYENRDTHEPGRFYCRFLHMCSGYYNYQRGFRPDFPGETQFEGLILHPQFWPPKLELRAKNVVIIGSGATAMTLLPALAQEASHVTMLQRSPTYVISRPAKDPLANFLRKILPAKWAYHLIRMRNVAMQAYFYGLAKRKPAHVRNYLLGLVRKAMGPDYDIRRHFTPNYNPWDQRLCLVPDGDLFDTLKSGRGQIVTDEIASFEARGLRLKSGDFLPADIVITATGLELQLLSGIDITVDGAPVKLADSFTYKGIMYSGVPNLVSTFGYVNASWTLKADLTAQFMCRVLNHMRIHHVTSATPIPGPGDMEKMPWLNFTPGYFQRAMHLMPLQGPKAPWRVYQNYYRDVHYLKDAPLDDGYLRFFDANSAPLHHRSAASTGRDAA